MSLFVLDASVALCWCLDGQETEYTAGVLGALETDACSAPALWSLEVANVLSLAQRRSKVAPETVDVLLGGLLELPIHIDSAAAKHIFQNVAPLARRLGITVYDACYLELALRTGLPLATVDAQLAKAAKEVRVKRFEP